MNRSTIALVLALALVAAALPALSAQGVGPSIVLSRGSLSVTEGGAAATYAVSLGSPSPAEVVVAITGAAGDLSAEPSSLTFPAGSTAAQTVTVLASNDAAVEGTESLAFVHTASSSDPAYQGRTATLPVTVTDNDLGIVLLHGGADATGTSVAEGGAQDTVRVALGAAPSSTVTVRLTPDPQLSLATLTLSFSPTNWKTPRDVAIAAANDQVAQGTRSKTVAAAAASSQAAYDGRTSTLQATILDNDVAGYLFTGPGQANLPADAVPTLAFPEGGESSFTLRLTSQPTGPVTVNLGGTSGATTVPASLTFGAGSWSTPQTVRVLRAQDAVDQGDTFAVTATLATSTSDPNYAAIPGPVAATVTDDDTAGILLAHTGGDTAVREGGPADAFTVSLVTQPQAAVTIGLAAPSGLTLDPASWTFDAGTWATPRTVTVRAVDDAAAGLPRSVAVTATASSGDAIYQGRTQTLAVRLLDDDGVLLVEETGGLTRVSEGGPADSFTVRLVGEPDAPVTVSLTASDGAQFTVDGAAARTLTFDPGTGTSLAAPCSANPKTTCRWDAPQAVQVGAVADHRIDGLRTGTIALVTSSADADFDAQATRPIGVTVVDTDVAGFILDGAPVGTLPALAVTEGGSTSYTIELASIPTGPVTVGLTGSNGAVASPASLTFDASSWTTARTVVVSVARDLVDQGDGYAAAVANTVTASSDAHYAGLAANVPVAVTDHPEDIAGWLFSAVGQEGLARDALPTFTLAEGQPGSYTLRPASKPTATVSVAFSGTAGAVASPASLSFGPSDWTTPKAVGFVVAQDKVDRGTTYTASVAQGSSSADPRYATIPGPVSATVSDDDVAALRWVATGASTVVEEGGATDVLHAILATEPAAPVTLALSAEPDLAVTPTSLTFTAADWDLPRAVTVSAVDDASPEITENRKVSAVATSADGAYQALTKAIYVTILDDDGVVALLPTGGSTSVTEGGASDAYSVKLAANPTSEVTVTIASPGGQLLFDGSPTLVLTFVPDMGSGSGTPVAPCPADPSANCHWNHPQAVTVTGNDDGAVEGTGSVLVEHEVASADQRFDGVPSAALQVLVLDNDRGLLLTPTDGGTQVAEGGASDTYTVALSMAPSFSVAVLVEAPDGLVATPDTLFFDAQTWAIPQTVTLVAVDDDIDRGTRVLQVAHRTSSADDTFNGLSAPPLHVTVHDDD